MNFYQLKLNDNETIDTIAFEYEIEREKLRQFHNNICSASQIIPKEIPKYLEFIYIPIEYYQKYIQNTIPEFKLKIPDYFAKTTYGVIYKNFNQHKQIHYTIEVEKLATNQIIVNKHKTFVNNQPVEKIIEELLEKTEKAIYPLNLSVKNNNSIDRIENSKEVSDRWINNIRPSISNYYQSKLTDEILEKLDLFFLNPNQYFDRIFHHLFYFFYFMPIYTSYTNGEKKSTIPLFLNVVNQQIYFELSFKLQKKYTRADKIKLEITGTESNSIVPNHNKATLDFTYILHKETHKIYSIAGSIIFYDENDNQHDLTFKSMN